jgi:hypothetical protein
VIANGIFMIAEFGGEAGERIREINLSMIPSWRGTKRRM